ncbi:hypothetical protein ACWIUH_08535 [Ursidibacter arcticus]
MKKEQLITNLKNIAFNLSHSSRNLGEIKLPDIESIISFISKDSFIIEENTSLDLFEIAFKTLDDKGLSFLYKSKQENDIEINNSDIYDFFGTISTSINTEITFLLSTYQNKIDLLTQLNSEETKKRLDLVSTIYDNKMEQDRKNENAQKLEISNKLASMSTDAASKVKTHTKTIGLLFLSLFFIPILLEYIGFFKSFKGIISDYFLYALVYIPIMLFIWYFIQQRSYAVKIATDYEFKLNYFNIFLYGHNWVDVKIENKEMQEQAYIGLINNLIAILADNPTRLYEKDPKGLPIDEVVSLVKEVLKK